MDQRRTVHETRDLLIETGVSMLYEHGVCAGVAHLRLKDVARQAGLTTGAAYKIWPSQAAFHDELAVAAVTRRHEHPLTRTLKAVHELVDAGAPLDEVLRRGAAAQLEGLVGAGDSGTPESIAFRNSLALRSAAAGNDELARAGRARHHESLDSFCQLYEVLLAAYGLEMRAPLTVRQFAIALAALGEGFALQAIEGEAHPLITLEDGEEWTLFAIAIQALVSRMTVPVSGAGHAP